MFRVRARVKIMLLSLLSAVALVAAFVSPAVFASATPTRSTPSAAAKSSSPSAATTSSTPWPGGQWQPDTPTYGMTVVSNIPLLMSDGTVLFANVGFPADPATCPTTNPCDNIGDKAPGTFPVLLTQNPYPASSAENPDPFFVSRGYIFVSAQVRGTGTSTPYSEANPLFDQRAAEDGVRWVNWAAHQLPGSNGIVGLTGCSFLGIDQIFTAAELGPNSPVKEILPACANYTYQSNFAGGIPGQTVSLFGVFSSQFGQQHLAANDNLGFSVGANMLAGGPDAYDGSYWQAKDRSTTANVAAQIVRNHIPALLWSGYNAADGPGSLEFYAALQNADEHQPVFGPMPTGGRATDRYQIIEGPWTHGQGLDKSIELEWYDTWLKGERTGLQTITTPIHVWENQSNRWINAATYPLVSNYTPYYLGTSRTLAPSMQGAGTDTVTWAQPTQAGSTVSYTSSPLTQGATLAGPVAASVYASSSNTNLELIATLYDVAPDGNATQVTTGDILGSLRAVDRQQSWYDADHHLILPAHPYTADIYLQPGAMNRFDIKLYPTFWSVQPGDSLRLTISTQTLSSDCTSATLIPGPALPCSLTTPQLDTLTDGLYQIEHSTTFPSSINLPLLPRSFFPTAPSGTTPTSSGLTEPLRWQSTIPPQPH